MASSADSPENRDIQQLLWACSVSHPAMGSAGYAVAVSIVDARNVIRMSYGAHDTKVDRAMRLLSISVLAVMFLGLMAAALAMAGDLQFTDGSHYFKVIENYMSDDLGGQILATSLLGSLAGIFTGGLMYLFSPQKPKTKIRAKSPEEVTPKTVATTKSEATTSAPSPPKPSARERLIDVLGGQVAFENLPIITMNQSRPGELQFSDAERSSPIMKCSFEHDGKTIDAIVISYTLKDKPKTSRYVVIYPRRFINDSRYSVDRIESWVASPYQDIILPEQYGRRDGYALSESNVEAIRDLIAETHPTCVLQAS